MLRKLIKYDFNYFIKYWLIAAAASVGLAVVSGFCFKVLGADNNRLEALQVLCLLLGVISVIAMLGLLVFSRILGVVRYYKNLFTDEGYLTFTLPVKSAELLASKVIVNYVFTFFSSVLLVINMVIILLIVGSKELFSLDVWSEISKLLEEFFGELGGFSVIYALQITLLSILLPLLQILVDYCCVTIAATLVRKYKVLVAIGIYYGVSIVTSYISQFATLSIGSNTILKITEKLGEHELMALVSVVLLAMSLLVALITLILYTYSTYLLNAKLNLE